jgi:hypothetical protein
VLNETDLERIANLVSITRNCAYANDLTPRLSQLFLNC